MTNDEWIAAVRVLIERAGLRIEIGAIGYAHGEYCSPALRDEETALMIKLKEALA